MRACIAIFLSLPLLVACERPITVIEEFPSPDGEVKAVVFTSFGGGVASDLHTSVSVLPIGHAQPDWPPNTFTATHQHEGSPEAAFFGPSITVQWVGTRTLEITYDPRASALRRNEVVRGVRVRYVVAPQEHRPSPGLPGDEEDAAATRQTISEDGSPPDPADAG